MCEWGTEVLLRVPIPASLAHDGQFRWDDRGVDACLAPMVERLNAAGMYTANCCCGHGKEPGSIHLHDGRELSIREAEALVDVAAYSTERRAA